MINNPAFTENISKILIHDLQTGSMNGLLQNLIDSIPTNISIWESGKVIYANPAFYKSLGLSPGDLDELNVLVESEGYYTVHPDDFDFSVENTTMLKSEIENGIVFHKEIRMKNRMNPDYRWYNTYIVKGADPNSNIVIEIDEDIHDKKTASEELKKALADKEQLIMEKELLLKEIHHRVKNNFQVISSLLNLQSVKTRDDEAKKALDESRSRIVSISKIHERLYRTNNLKLVDVNEIIKEIVIGLVNLYNCNTRLVKFIYNCHDIHLSIDKAIPVMLIINEIVSNSLKYAFDDFEKACMKIEFTEESEKNYRLTISDNGKGYPDGYSEKSGSIGLMIVKTFAKQIDGSVEFKNKDGAEFTLLFKQ
ncbi:MAG: PAS domain-containing protein [Ignavibacteria bacterium]|nr:PAS domain-containing protein [Ignavibacteria bacterium]